MSGYFKNFPLVIYGGALATNITARAKLNSAIRDKTAVFYPYTVQDGERPDTIAEQYYGDPYFAWLIYYANDIVDPYYDWPLTQHDFGQMIIEKYGSVAEAQERIMFFRVNWLGDESMISTSAYEALATAVKKYWNPVINYRGQIIAYERARHDWVVETNYVIELTVDTTAGFELEQKITQGTTSGFVKYITDTTITVDKIQGEFVTSEDVTNGTDVATVSAVTEIANPIGETEAAYWTPVSAYDYEEELNESKKHIKIIDKRYLNQIEMEMKTLLK